MSDVEKAASGLSQGLNCAQSIVSTYGPRFGLDRDLALRVASGFGGGIGYQGESCGAVTGAIMVIGLKEGGVSGDEAARERFFGLIGRFLEEFKARHGSIMCRQLLGHDISTDEGLQAIMDKGLFEELCPNFVRTSADIIEEIL
jgi:C_GCAxxG_C_C family probable redox protein